MHVSNINESVNRFSTALRRAFGGGFFSRYLAVGAIVFVIDVGLFQTFVALRVTLWIGTSIAYAVGVVVHFLLNKYVNFRAFDRTILAQARTYVILQIPTLVVTALVVEVCTYGLHLMPLVAKAISIAINLPIGFLSHRYLTFSAGIGSMARRVIARYRS